MQKQIVIKIVTAIIGIVLLCALFIPANLSGTRDFEMLGVENLDEHQQYENLLPMIAPGEHWRITVNHLLQHTYYYYGYPFFFVSGVSLIAAHSLGMPQAVHLDVLLLRELSVLFSVLAIWLVVYLTIGFRRRWESAVLFLFIFTLPSVVENNLWWHPDALALLCVIATLVFLLKDAYRFKRYFYLAAFTCGLATAIKLVGLFFGPTIAVYVLIAVITKRLTWVKAVLAGIVFTVVMAATFVVSNPFLIHPADRLQYITTQQEQIGRLGDGWVVRSSAFDWFAIYGERFAFIGIWALALVGLVWCIVQKKDAQKKLAGILVVTWSVPYAIYLWFSVGLVSWKYVLPIAIPVLAFTTIGINIAWQASKVVLWKRWLLIIFLAVCIVGQGWVIGTSIKIYREQLLFEENNPSLQFYNDVVAQNIVSATEQQVLYHDWAIYFANTPNVESRQKFGVFNYNDINLYHPDVILLSKDVMNSYLDPTQQYVEDDIQEIQKFYTDVKNNTVTGYTIVFQNDFGIALVQQPN